MRLQECLLLPSGLGKRLSNNKTMKTSFNHLRVFAVAGVASFIMQAAPLAQAALGAADVSRVNGASSATLATTVASMISAVPAASREQLAKDIAAHIARNRSGLAPQAIAAMVKLIPNSAAAVVSAAVQANRNVTFNVVYAVAKELPAQAAPVAAAVAQVNNALATIAAQAAAKGAPAYADAITQQVTAAAPALAAAIAAAVIAGVASAEPPPVTGGNPIVNSVS